MLVGWDEALRRKTLEPFSVSGSNYAHGLLCCTGVRAFDMFCASALSDASLRMLQAHELHSFSGFCSFHTILICHLPYASVPLFRSCDYMARGSVTRTGRTWRDAGREGGRVRLVT
jgi:hypothetical protein